MVILPIVNRIAGYDSQLHRIKVERTKLSENDGFFNVNIENCTVNWAGTLRVVNVRE